MKSKAGTFMATESGKANVLVLANIVIGFVIGILLYISLSSTSSAAPYFSFFVLFWLVLVFIAIYSKNIIMLLITFILSVLIIISLFAPIFTFGQSSVSCPQVLVNTTKSQLLLLINETKIENAEGACALSALAYYNNSNTLTKFNISVNLNRLNLQYHIDLPNVTVLNSSIVQPNSIAP
jgi:hypothetical protein